MCEEEEVTLYAALNKYRYYGHGEQGYGIMCNASKGTYCSMCGVPNALSWVVRHSNEGFSLETMENMVSKWKTEKWYKWKETLPYVKVMLNYLRQRSEEDGRAL
jgi:hypothetical protein